MSSNELGVELSLEELDEEEIISISNWLNGKKLAEMLGVSQYIAVTVVSSRGMKKEDSRGKSRIVFECEVEDSDEGQYKIDFTPKNISQLARVVLGWNGKRESKPLNSVILNGIVNNTVKIGAQLNPDGKAYHVDVISAKEVTSFASVQQPPPAQQVPSNRQAPQRR